MSVHPTVAAFSVADGSLLIGGMPVGRLVERVGSTPFFAYERRLIEARVDLLRRSLPGIDLSYAVKANPMPAVVHCLSGLVDSLDVASAGELRTALDTGKDPSHISFAGPGKTVAELSQAVAAGVMIELESATEARRVMDIAERTGVTPRVSVRVNPDFGVKGSGMRMGGGPQQFGVDAEVVPVLLKDLAREGLEVQGFHIFAGSQNLHADILCEAQSRTVDLALRLAGDAGLELRYLNLGGGFGIPYYEKDEPLDLARVTAHLTSLMEGRVRREIPGARVVLELGRFLVGEAGVYVTRIVDRKESRGRTFLIVDGGMHHQLAASGNLGQVIRRNYPLVIANRMADEVRETASVVGCLCTPLDVLGDRMELPVAEIGDVVVLFQAGAYGLSASPTAFLGHPAPVEVLV